MAKKGNRVQVILECTEQKQSGVPGMSLNLSKSSQITQISTDDFMILYLCKLE